jgi:hypothetical protein
MTDEKDREGRRITWLAWAKHAATIEQPATLFGTIILYPGWKRT